MQYRTQKIKSRHVVVNRQRVSTFDDLIVYISCNSLIDKGLEDAIYSLSTYSRLIIMPMVVPYLIALLDASGVGTFEGKSPIKSL